METPKESLQARESSSAPVLSLRMETMYLGLVSCPLLHWGPAGTVCASWK